MTPKGHMSSGVLVASGAYVSGAGAVQPPGEFHTQLGPDSGTRAEQLADDVIWLQAVATEHVLDAALVKTQSKLVDAPMAAHVAALVPEPSAQVIAAEHVFPAKWQPVPREAPMAEQVDTVPLLQSVAVMTAA